MKPCCDAIRQKTSLTIALVGNPNCGKTTLFNALTGSAQHVGNWPGVTVERKSGSFTQSGVVVEVVDLPGVYSLTQAADIALPDESITTAFIHEQKADVIVNIVDASLLERHLYLTTQLLEMNKPVVLALNMMDIAANKKIQIDIAQLSQQLGCPVVALKAHQREGISELKHAVITYSSACRVKKELPYPAVLMHAIQALSHELASDHATGLAIRLLEDDKIAQQQVSSTMLEKVRIQQANTQQALGEDADILLADTRYRFIGQLLQTCVSHTDLPKTSLTTRIDKIVLNRILGIPIFLAIMYLLFVFSIKVGGSLQDFFDISSQQIFVDGFAYCLHQMGAEPWLIALLANGIGKGINTTLTFIPVIGSLFLFLALLEDSGYMARAAFIVDRFMRMLGLPGKAFVPLIIGFGCNVPAVMSARTLETKRDRILTIMMTPFMSCGARLAIFAVFTAAFFPHNGQNIVFALYLIGIVMAILTGFLLRTTVLQGEPSPFVMELPAWHLPHMRTVFLHTSQRLKGFIYRAGSLIVPICILIGALNALNLDGSLNSGAGDSRSLLSTIGQWITPIFAPMGIQADNWPATVGLLTGILSKEVVIGTLNTLYSQAGSLAQAHVSAVSQDVYGLMYQHFDGQAGAFSYLLFVLLYFPCVSTMAVMMRELHRGWAVFSAVWMTSVAYGTAVIFYQAETFRQHSFSSSIWMLSIAMVLLGTIVAGRLYASSDKQMLAVTAGGSA